VAYEEQAIPTVTTAAPAAAPLRRAKWWSGVLKFIRKKPLGAIGFAIVGVLIFATLGTPKLSFGAPSLPDRPLGFELGRPWLQRYSPDATFKLNSRAQIFEGVSSEHWLGTDKAGRDVWSRVINGARRSLFVGLWALILATIIGATIGIVSGYFGGLLDTVVQRLMDALQSFPPLIALILLVSINPLTTSPNLLVIAFALGFVGIPSVQRIVRAVVLATREQQYVEAARTIGASDLRTMRYYRARRGHPGRIHARLHRPGQAAGRPFLGRHAQRSPTRDRRPSVARPRLLHRDRSGGPGLQPCRRRPPRRP
jgi:ABC-type dipeptide/oligopeptide/nickel transport system permease subunit